MEKDSPLTGSPVPAVFVQADWAENYVAAHKAISNFWHAAISKNWPAAERFAETAIIEAGKLRKTAQNKPTGTA